MRFQTLVMLGCVLFLACLMGGCGEGGDDIRAYTAPKEPPAVKPVEWAVPAGWREVRAGEMQFARFAVDPEHPDAALTIVPLPREANELAPNVNRWEGQLGLPPSPPEAVEQMVSHVDVDGAHADVVDLTGSDAKSGAPQRLLAAIVPHGRLTWFFTLKASPDVVAAQKPNFDAFVRSLKFKDDGDEPAGHDQTQLAMADAAGAAGQQGDAQDRPRPATQPLAERIEWGKLPAGWAEDRAPRPMRVHTLVVEANGQKGEVIVSRFPPSQVGPLLDNLNRWRAHVGLERTDDPAAHQPRELTVIGAPGVAFDMEGPAKDGQPAKRQVVAMGAQGNMFWFFRFLGPVELVNAQQAAFENVLRDARFAGAAAAPGQPPATGPSSTQPAGSPR